MNGAKDIFSSSSIDYTTLCMSHVKIFVGDKQKVQVEIRLYPVVIYPNRCYLKGPER